MEPLLITGLGTVSPAGTSVGEFWAGVCGAQLHPQVLDDALVAPRHMANRQFYRSKVPPLFPSALPSVGMASRFAYHAVIEALEDACVDRGSQRVGLVIGTGAGDIDRFELDGFSEDAGAAGTDAESAYAIAGPLASTMGLGGPILTVSTACSASAAALHCAEDILDSGAADAVVVCGTESASRTTLAVFNIMLALDPVACRPFTDDRQGTVLGDGAAAVVLQPADSANADGRAYALLRGIGLTCDAHHPTAPRPDGAMIAGAVDRALQAGGIAPDQVDLIVPHGTGTAANDQVEYDMLRRLFGPRLSSIPLFPLKGRIGHGGGAAGAFSVLALALMLRYQKVPPSPWWRPDGQFELRVPRDCVAVVSARFGLINAYSFGGANTALLLEATHDVSH